MKRIHLAAAFVAVAGIAAASALTVTQRDDTVNIFAERFTLRDELEVGQSVLLPSPAAMTALGVNGAPVEMTAGMPPARTAIARDHWVYQVPIREKTLTSATRGEITLRLLVDNVPAGTIHVIQDATDAGAVEGVVAQFDIGATLSSDALYFVEVKPVVRAGPVVPFVVRSNPNGNLTWLGVGEPIDALVNPDLVVPVGSTIQIKARNADAGIHDIGIRDSGGNLVNPPGWSPDIPDGGETTIAWTPEAAGTFSYVCKYHASTMKGVLRVTAT